jgi:hypothetical protein
LLRNNPEYNCDDQPAKVAQRLTSATGQQWTSLYHAEFTRDVRGERMSELGTLVPWSQQQAGGARALIGDFNSNPRSPEYQQARTGYSDAWADALAASTAQGRIAASRTIPIGSISSSTSRPRWS